MSESGVVQYIFYVHDKAVKYCNSKFLQIVYFFIILFQSDFSKESDVVESFQCTETQINRFVMNFFKTTTII